MTPVWRLWIESKLGLRHAYWTHDSSHSLCGRAAAGRTIACDPPSLRAVLDGNVCWHCHARVRAHEQRERAA